MAVPYDLTTRWPTRNSHTTSVDSTADFNGSSSAAARMAAAAVEGRLAIIPADGSTATTRRSSGS